MRIIILNKIIPIPLAKVFQIRNLKPKRKRKRRKRKMIRKKVKKKKIKKEQKSSKGEER